MFTGNYLDAASIDLMKPFYLEIQLEFISERADVPHRRRRGPQFF